MLKKESNYVLYYGSTGQKLIKTLSVEELIKEKRSNKEDFSLSKFIHNVFNWEYSVLPFEADGKFVDHEFPPKKESIFEDSANRKEQLKWVRAETLSNNGKIFEKIVPEEMKQGYFGNCWFVAAVCCLAEKQELLERIFGENKISPIGKYKLNLFKNGQPVSVKIDSLIPVGDKSNACFGSSSNLNQMWVPLLEKAYSKLNGSYKSLTSGECHEAFFDMTGCPSGLLEAPKIEFQWLQQKFRDGGYLMTAGINSKKPGHGYFKMMSQGLLIDHAYAIIDVREHTETGREPVRLVKLRNPWSRFEWNGDYSDHSSKWDPKLRKDLHLCADDNDGVFWMDFGHFRSIFDTFSFCDSRHEWRSIPKSFSFNLQNERVESPRFSFKVPGKMVLKYLSLHQNDKRIKSSPQNYIDLAGFVLKNGEGYFEDQKCVGLLESNIDRNTFSKFKLQTGEYTFVPYSSGSHFGGQNLRDVTVLLHLTPEKSDKIRLKTENGDLKTENGDLKTENVELKTENGELKTENGELKTENGELKTENVELKTENGESEKLVKKLDHNEKAMEKAKLLSLKTMATVMKNDDGVFSLRTVKNGGLVLFGVDNLAEKYANVKFSIDVGASSNLLPTLDSWSKETTCSFTMDKEDLKTTALVGSFIRANNEKCSFSAKVNYSAIDN